MLAAQNPLAQTDRPHQLFADAPPMPVLNAPMPPQMSFIPPPPPPPAPQAMMFQPPLPSQYQPQMTPNQFIPPPPPPIGNPMSFGLPPPPPPM